MGARRSRSGSFGKTRIKTQRRRQITRRQFLAGTTLTGVALTLPPWLVGCSDDDQGAPNTTPTATPSPTPGGRAREQRTLHFDFSYAPLSEPRLQAFNSASHLAAVLMHTPESRARFRALNPALNNVPDARLTHYIEDVDLPADALQHLWVTGSAADGGEAVAAMFIHVPEPQRSAAGDNVLNGGNDYANPASTAQSLVFHNPEIMNLNVDQGSTILNLIAGLPCTSTEPTCTPFLGTLAAMIAEKWPATTSGGWATLVQVTDPSGMPVVNSQGKPAYRWDLDMDIAQEVAAVAAQIKNSIFDNPQFMGTNWHPTQGMTVSQNSGASGLIGRGAGTDQFSLTAAYPAGTTAHGVDFQSISVISEAARTIQLQFRNRYLRYLSTYVQFANENGPLPVANPDSQDTSRAKFLSWINSNYTVLGIPLLGNSVPLSSVQFNVPTDASIANVFFGSLGLGGEAFSPEALDGAILTLVFNIGLPTIFLAAGVAATEVLLQQLSEQFGVTLLQILRASLPLILGIAAGDLANGIFGSANSHSATDALISLGSAVLSAIFATGRGAALLVEIGVVIATGESVDLLGPVGAIFRAIAVLSDLAAIIQSVAEVLSNPAIFINTLTLTMTTTVTVSKDMDDFQFPATARNYEVRLVYDSASTLAHVMSGTIEPGRVDPIVVVFNDVPSGGNVTVDVYLTTDTGCIVGRSKGTDGVTPGPYGPVPGTQASIDIMIKELLIPLLETTQYLHDLKLEYQGGQHVWVETAAPTATIANLGQGQQDALYDLNGITVSQRTGMAGYAYRAGGQGVPFCGETMSDIEFMVQNVFLGENPDRALKQLPCGFPQIAGIVYDRLGPASGVGLNFFLQPTANGFFVQSITLDDSTPIDINNPLSWGVFSEALDSLSVVPAGGFLVGVNTQTHHMLILKLPAAPVDASQAPQAVPFAVQKMGLGTRTGLLNAPVAVVVIDATILILESGNQRIQAVDVSGNPVPLFHNGTSSIVALRNETGVTYLDLGVEGKGYMYVLSFINDGMDVADYRLDVYDPQGDFLTRTIGVAAARLAVDTFRNVYTQNYETVANAPRIEPSLSQWNPSTPEGCPTAPPVTPSPTGPPTTPSATVTP